MRNSPARQNETTNMYICDSIRRYVRNNTFARDSELNEREMRRHMHEVAERDIAYTADGELWVTITNDPIGMLAQSVYNVLLYPPPSFAPIRKPYAARGIPY